jgi:hypothetical protein
MAIIGELRARCRCSQIIPLARGRARPVVLFVVLACAAAAAAIGHSHAPFHADGWAEKGASDMAIWICMDRTMRSFSRRARDDYHARSN